MGMIDEIRAQYEKLAAQNKLEAEDMIKARVAKASEQAKKDGEQIRDMKDQIGEYRKTVQTLHMEIDSLRSAVSKIRTSQIFEFKKLNKVLCMERIFFGGFKFFENKNFGL